MIPSVHRIKVNGDNTYFVNTREKIYGEPLANVRLLCVSESSL